MLLYLSSLRSVCKPGWLLVELPLEAGASGRQRVQFVYFLGRDDVAGGTSASTTIRAETSAGLQIVDRWGPALQRVIWDGVLDLIEGALVWERERSGAGDPALLGFGCGASSLHVDVLGGRA